MNKQQRTYDRIAIIAILLGIYFKNPFPEDVTGMRIVASLGLVAAGMLIVVFAESGRD